MIPAVPTPEVEAFARRVRGQGHGPPRRVLVVADVGVADWLRSEGFAVETTDELGLSDHQDHSLDGVWFGVRPSLDLRPVFRMLHHGFVRVPLDGDRADKLELELALERASFEIVERVAGLIGWTRLVTPRVGAAAVVFDDEGRLLLANRADGRGWCLPGGYCDAHEPPQETIVREVREEVGLEVDVEGLLGIYSVTQRSGEKIVAITFSCRVIGGEAGTSDETIDVGWFSEEALPSPLFGAHPIRIADAFAVRRGAAVPPFLRDTVEAR
jgi:8-oxo-dGTP diphosphatase